MKKWLIILLFPLVSFSQDDKSQSWIRINQLGYTTNGVKVAVWGSKKKEVVTLFHLWDAKTKKIVYSSMVGENFGAYGPFTLTFRLNFSSFKKPGRYYLTAGGAISPEFEIGNDVYNGAADFCLR